MLDVVPFVATRYGDAAALPRLTSPAYDLIAPVERERLVESDEHSIVHLTLRRRRRGPARPLARRRHAPY